MNTSSLIATNSHSENIDSKERVKKLISFLLSYDSDDENLKSEIAALFQAIRALKLEQNRQGMSESKLIDQLKLTSKDLKIITPYLSDLNLINDIKGLGAGGNRKKNKNAPINDPKNVKNVKDIVTILSAVTVLIGSALTPVVTNLQNDRMVDLERIRLKQRERELDQRDRELDIQEKQLFDGNKP